jgi:hypothetical protein
MVKLQPNHRESSYLVQQTVELYQIPQQRRLGPSSTDLRPRLKPWRRTAGMRTFHVELRLPTQNSVSDCFTDWMLSSQPNVHFMGRVETDICRSTAPRLYSPLRRASLRLRRLAPLRRAPLSSAEPGAGRAGSDTPWGKERWPRR